MLNRTLTQEETREIALSAFNYKQPPGIEDRPFSKVKANSYSKLATLFSLFCMHIARKINSSLIFENYSTSTFI